MMSEHYEIDELHLVLGRSMAGIRREAGLIQAQLAVRLRGTTSVVRVTQVVQTFKRSTGPSRQTFWTGYWSAAGS